MDASEAPQSDSSTPKSGDASTNGADRAATDASLPLSELQSELLTFALDSPDRATLLESMGGLVNRYTNSVGVVHFRRDAHEGWTAHDVQALDDLNTTFGVDESTWQAWCAAAISEGHVQQNRIEGALPAVVMTVPVTRADERPDAFCVVFRASRDPSYGVIILLQSVAAHLTLWYVCQQFRGLDRESSELCALVEVIGKMQETDSLQHASYVVANDLQQFLQCDRVAVGLHQGGKGHCHLQALSGVANYDKRSAYVRTVESALDEAMLKKEVTVWTASDAAKSEACLAHQKLGGLEGCETVISSPLRTADGETVGAWLFLGDQRLGNLNGVPRFVGAASATVGATLAVMEEARCGLFVRLKRRIQKHLRSRWMHVTMAVAVVAIAVLCVPLPYKLKCDSTVEPVTRRFIAAPFDSTLEKTLVEPGDVVQKGDILAELDGRELRWELAGLESDLNRAEKERDTAMAARKTAEAQIARLEMEGLQLKIQMLRHRSEQLRIESPVDGIVVTGDLKRVEGAPLTVGQTLFEIAPLGEMIVEVAIPESEVAHVQEGQKVHIKVESYPDQDWTGILSRVHPRSEIRDDDSVFIGEVTLNNSSGDLRPGMRGESKVVGSSRALGWILFHRPWHVLRQYIGW